MTARLLELLAGCRPTSRLQFISSGARPWPRQRAHHVASEPASAPKAVAEERGWDHLPKPAIEDRGEVDFCPCNSAGADLSINKVFVGGFRCKNVQMEQELEGHYLGNCILWKIKPWPVRVRAKEYGTEHREAWHEGTSYQRPPEHYWVEGHCNIQSVKVKRQWGEEQEKDKQVTKITDNCKTAGC